MIGKLDPEERVLDSVLPEWFAQTSNDPYDRHNYRLHFKNGKSVDFDDYMNVQAAWFQYESKFLSHIEILDKKKTTGGGFK